MKKTLLTLSALAALALSACSTPPQTRPQLRSMWLSNWSAISLPQPGDFSSKQIQTYVGRIENTAWMVGVAVGEKEVAAFFSDGKSGEWIGGQNQNGWLSLKGARTALEAKLGNTVTGKVWVDRDSSEISLTPAITGRTGLFRSAQVVKGALQERGVIVVDNGIRGATVRSAGRETDSGAGTSADHEPLEPGSGLMELPVVDDMKRYPPDAPNPKEYLDGHGSASEIACSYYSAMEHYLEARIYQIELELGSVSVLDSSEEQRQDRELLDFLEDRLLNARDQVDHACFGINYKG